jgi:uncharacterized protein (UPF0147 family)
MPFDEDEDIVVPAKTGLKQVKSTNPLLNKPKKQTQEEFNELVRATEEVKTGYKYKASELTLAFNKILNDKTLPQNKHPLAKDMESEIISNMIHLSSDISNDPNEPEGYGALMWVVLLLKFALSQRDKINTLEYNLMQVSKKVDARAAVKLEGLDKPQGSA